MDNVTTAGIYQPQKFIKKPLQVEAMFFARGNASRVFDWVRTYNMYAQFKTEPDNLRDPRIIIPQPTSTGNSLTCMVEFYVAYNVENRSFFIMQKNDFLNLYEPAAVVVPGKYPSPILVNYESLKPGSRHQEVFDKYAAAALQGILSSDSKEGGVAVNLAIAYAKDMIDARNKYFQEIEKTHREELTKSLFDLTKGIE